MGMKIVEQGIGFTGCSCLAGKREEGLSEEIKRWGLGGHVSSMWGAG